MELRSHCPINFGLEHFGDKWTLLIMRDLMFKKKRHYNEFLEADEKVSTSVLSTRLKNLEAYGLIWKSEDSVKKSRIRYSLTEKGIALLPVLTDLIVWSAKYDTDSEVEVEFVRQVKADRSGFLAQLNKDLELNHLPIDKQ